MTDGAAAETQFRHFYVVVTSGKYHHASQKWDAKDKENACLSTWVRYRMSLVIYDDLRRAWMVVVVRQKLKADSTSRYHDLTHYS